MRILRVLNKYKLQPGEYGINIMRGTPWGNIYSTGTRDEKVDNHRWAVEGAPDYMARIRRELAGANLVCCCAPLRCHGDTLLRIANKGKMSARLIYIDSLQTAVLADDRAQGRGYIFRRSCGHGSLTTDPYITLATDKTLTFQRGNPLMQGVNGLTTEAVIAVLIDRLEVLNEEQPHTQNEEAIKGLRAAKAALELREKELRKEVKNGEANVSSGGSQLP